MSRVTFGEAVSYGFSLIGYLVLVIIVGTGLIFVGGLIGVGGGLSSENAEDAAIWFILGGLITIMGWLTIVAGMYGVFYKVIADAVNRGQVTYTPMLVNTQSNGAPVVKPTPSGIPKSTGSIVVNPTRRTITKSARFDEFEF
jgi:hypothetical protein